MVNLNVSSHLNTMLEVEEGLPQDKVPSPSLPQNVLNQIFNYLSFIEWQCASYVNKDWHICIESVYKNKKEFCTIEAIEDHFSQKRIDLFYQFCEKRFVNLKKISIQNGINDTILALYTGLLAKNNQTIADNRCVMPPFI
jgi:F-box-like